MQWMKLDTQCESPGGVGGLDEQGSSERDEISHWDLLRVKLADFDVRCERKKSRMIHRFWT